MPRMIQATERSVAELLSPTRRFRTPPYQRAYSWTTEEASRLYADLRAHQTAIAASDAPEPFFLGNAIFVTAPNAPDSEIVDGQQRLLTLTILLAVLRDLDRNASALAAGHILARRLFGGAVEPLIAPRKRDAAFFLEHVQKAGATAALSEDIAPDNDAQARMLENALWLRGQLSQVPARELRWLAEFVLRGCWFIEVASPSEPLAHQIFQVVNDRGLPLRVNDVLKAEVVGALPDAARGEAAARWEEVEADLGDQAYTQLFSHLRALHRPQKATRAVLTELRELLRPDADPERFVMRELLPRGYALRAIRANTLPLPAHADRANRLLRGLNRLPNRDWETLAVGFFADRRPRGDEAAAFLTALDRLAYALALMSADENTRLARYRKPILALRDGASTAELVTILELTENEQRTARRVLEGPFYTKERIRLPVLLRIDEALAESAAWYDAPTISVEHVLPRNPPPDSPWLAAFPDATERKRWTDRIGNLTLLSRRKNQSAANLPFERKKREYFAAGATTPFAITTRLITEPDWTPEALERRQKLLVETARRLWRL